MRQTQTTIITLALLSSLVLLGACDNAKTHSKAQEPGDTAHAHGEHGHDHDGHDHHQGSAASKDGAAADASKEGSEEEHACTCGTDVPCQKCAHGGHRGGGHDHHAHHGGAPDADEVPADQSGEGKTERGEFVVKYKPSPNPIPFQKHFTLELEVYDAKDTSKPLEGVKIDQVRAIMPAHNHGMKVEPKIEEVAPGKFKVDGMRFHMQGPGKDGLWVLEAVVNHDGRIDQTKFELQCCRQP